MKYKKLLFVIIVIVGLSTMNQGLIEVNNSLNNRGSLQLINDSDVDVNANKVDQSINPSDNKREIQDNLKQGILSTEGAWEESSMTIDETLGAFNPNIDIKADYSGQSINGKVEDGNSIVSVPGEGEYSLTGDIINMEAQYLQNSGAETGEPFYSENVIQAGLSLERLEDVRSVEGNYVWKFFSSNTETMTYSLYQENINLYQTDTRISYNYLLESNSSIQNIINSSLIFDFVFDTCRIMVIHWHYTDIDPPDIGENTTTPFVVYRLLENSSWNDQWNFYSLNISDLFSYGDPYIPSVLKSIGFYVISPEFSECSLLIDDFKIVSSMSPEDINLSINGIQVIETSINSGTVNFISYVNQGSSNEIDLIWSHNSTFEISTEYHFNITGIIEIQFDKTLEVFEDATILLSIATEQIGSEINQVNITFPGYWILNGSIQNFLIQGFEVINDNYTTLIISKEVPITNLICQFDVENFITAIALTEQVIFEDLNATIGFEYFVETVSASVFWFGEEDGSMVGEIINETIFLNFPANIPNGEYEITFIATNLDYIGVVNTTVTLTRFPAELDISDYFEIPQFGLQEINISYVDFNTKHQIEESDITAILEGEEIFVESLENSFVLHLSTFYLDLGEFSLEIYASSITHATIVKSIDITVIESVFESEFNYIKLDSLLHYQFNFIIRASSFPVGLAPLKVEVGDIETKTGITDSGGKYSFDIELPLNQEKITVNCSIIHKYNVIYLNSYEVSFENLQATVIQDGDIVVSSDNITLCYQIIYPESFNRWFLIMGEEMKPISSAYIEIDTLRIPVYWDENVIYWETYGDESRTNHRLFIETTGPEITVSLEDQEDEILIHFLIDAKAKSYSNISFMYYLNESYSTEEYTWKLFSSSSEDVTNMYSLQVTDAFVIMSDIDLAKGSYLILDLVGVKKSNMGGITGIVIPIVSSSSVILGAVAAIVKIYNKKKGMILEI